MRLFLARILNPPRIGFEPISALSGDFPVSRSWSLVLLNSNPSQILSLSTQTITSAHTLVILWEAGFHNRAIRRLAIACYTSCLPLYGLLVFVLWGLSVRPGGGTSSRFQSRASPRLMSATVTVNNCGRSIRFPFGQSSKQPQPLQGTEYSNQFNKSQPPKTQFFYRLSYLNIITTNRNGL